MSAAQADPLSTTVSTSLIMPDPLSIFCVQIPINDDWKQRWLAIKLEWPHIPVDWIQEETEETVATLRALSQTSGYIRALALPRLWAVTQVATVEQLGRLRETLRASPDIAQHIRSFTFAWDMPDALHSREMCEPGDSLFDLAFRDRFSSWNDLRQQHGCEVQRSVHSQRWYFDYDGTRYFAPGEYPDTEQEDWIAASRLRTGGSGPGGRGEDRLVKNAEQFTESVNEIIGQLSSLEAFGWN